RVLRNSGSSSRGHSQIYAAGPSERQCAANSKYASESSGRSLPIGSETRVQRNAGLPPDCRKSRKAQVVARRKAASPSQFSRDAWNAVTTIGSRSNDLACTAYGGPNFRSRKFDVGAGKKP